VCDDLCFLPSFCPSCLFPLHASPSFVDRPSRSFTMTAQRVQNKVERTTLAGLLFQLSLIHLAKARVAYPAGCSNKPPSYYDYDNYTCPPQHLRRSRKDFRLVRRLGAGKFSDVFEAVDEKTARQRSEIVPESLVVIKVSSLVQMYHIADTIS